MLKVFFIEKSQSMKETYLLDVNLNHAWFSVYEKTRKIKINFN